MAIIEFVKGAGENLDDKAEADLATALKQRVVETGVTVKFLAVVFNDGTALVTGTVATHADREKVVLAIGNTHAVARVDDKLTVEQPAAPQFTMYTVKGGDTLSAIAKNLLGDAKRYPEIFEANKPMLKDPNKIFVGQVLRIPPKTHA